MDKTNNLLNELQNIDVETLEKLNRIIRHSSQKALEIALNKYCQVFAYGDKNGRFIEMQMWNVLIDPIINKYSIEVGEDETLRFISNQLGKIYSIDPEEKIYSTELRRTLTKFLTNKCYKIFGREAE